METEWALSDDVFEIINNYFGPFYVDLFASNNNKKCKNYVSWKPDPYAIAVDAFTIYWSNMHFYAFPPFNLILLTLQKIIEDKAEGVLVVPLWKTQAWFPLFNSMLTSRLFVFGTDSKLLFSPFSKVHPLASNLTLSVARLSGKRIN